ncbi:TolC family protein [Bryobacter aggregatus]|uniref:TolC family protein n=1 Tax=Bryobacter aggregatus TaxID=360054 RepID=UPI0004E1354E|nr:TolC family protein [Bryobacter aggregatus]
MLRTISTSVLLCCCVFGQTTTTTTTAPNVFNDSSELSPYPQFGTKNYFATIFRRDTPKFELQGPVRLQDHVVGEKLELSLKAYLELALNNNTDIQIQRLSLEIPKNAITRAFSMYDPQFVGRFGSTRSKTAATDALAGATTVSTLSQPLTLNWSQLAPTGTQYSVNYGASKNSTNSTFASLNPAYSSNLNLAFTQPLWRGRDLSILRAPITLAKSRLRANEYAFQDQLQQLLTNAENAYWDVIGARENQKVQEQALALADTSLKRAQRELELGALPALEIYQPQAVYARAEILVTQARYRLAQAEDALRRQMGIDLDPELRKLPIILTESVLPPTDNTPFDKESIVADAIRLRPDLLNQRQQLDIDEIGIKVTSDSLKPDFSLFGNYSIQGRGGPFIQRQNIFNPDGTTSPVVSTIPGGIGDALGQMWGFGYPIIGGGVQLRLPIKDRNASANYADAVVSKRLDQLRLRVVEQNVRLDVLTAINQVENSRASVDLAKIAADLAQKRVEADQKRYELGTITLFFLLDSQNALTQAQSDLVTQSVQYRRNLLNLYRRGGTLLTERGISTN